MEEHLTDNIMAANCDYIGSYHLSIYHLSIYRRPLVFAVDNLVISWPILMKLGMGVDIGMG